MNQVLIQTGQEPVGSEVKVPIKKNLEASSFGGGILLLKVAQYNEGPSRWEGALIKCLG
jgi:hypothetical protein